MTATSVSVALSPTQHQEFSFLLKERVCPLVIKLFSPNIKFRQGSSASSPAPVEKPYFPICMRLLRVVSVLIKHFYSLLVINQFLVNCLEPVDSWVKKKGFLRFIKLLKNLKILKNLKNLGTLRLQCKGHLMTYPHWDVLCCCSSSFLFSR